LFDLKSRFFRPDPGRLRSAARKILHEAIAELRGQLAAVMNLVGTGNSPKLFEAEQTVRTLKVSTRES
jgi:hypothetical protein